MISLGEVMQNHLEQVALVRRELDQAQKDLTAISRDISKKYADNDLAERLDDVSNSISRITT